jgi:hypothetical protein
MTLVSLHSKDLWPWVPHLKQVTLLVPVDALDDAVDCAGCFIRLWAVGWLDGVEEEEGFTLVGDVVGVSLEAKYALVLLYLMSSSTCCLALEA